MCSYHNISAQSRTEKSALEPPPINSIWIFQGLSYKLYCQTLIINQIYIFRLQKLWAVHIC
jgi:hypothetical protein